MGPIRQNLRGARDPRSPAWRWWGVAGLAELAGVGAVAGDSFLFGCGNWLCRITGEPCAGVLLTLVQRRGFAMPRLVSGVASRRLDG